MKYAENQTVRLEPEHEETFYDDMETTPELSFRPVEIKLLQSIHSRENPFITYWEIEYLDSTPNKEKGETVVMTENSISNYEVPMGAVEQETEKYGLLADPQ